VDFKIEGSVHDMLHQELTWEADEVTEMINHLQAELDKEREMQRNINE
jgi:hypothetical protein